MNKQDDPCEGYGGQGCEFCAGSHFQIVEEDEFCRCCGFNHNPHVHGVYQMEEQYLSSDFGVRAAGILHNMALEWDKPWWWRMFRRWFISDEPLRNDAANLLKECEVKIMRPEGTRYVSDARRED